MIELVKADELFWEEVNGPTVELDENDYIQRTGLLQQRMKKLGFTYVVIYGDREHFANIEYFTKYDCRFEEGLFVMAEDGEKSIIVGNEGAGFSKIIPYAIHKYLYQNFSLQGQPRDCSPMLTDIFREIGITREARVGVVGYKYFETPFVTTNPKLTFDVPQYIMEQLTAVCPNIENFTREITGLPNGIRMKLHSAKEIAWAEAQGNQAAAVIQRMVKNLKPGIKEYELAQESRAGFEPRSMHPIVNFGADRVELGMDSPGDSALKTGEVCGLCYGVRGSLTSRTGIAAYDFDTCNEELKPYIESFYKKYYEAIVAWYETAKVGATGGEIYKAVMDIIGGEEFGVALNPSHNTGSDEWTNSGIYENSDVVMKDGEFMQVDIIASTSNPIRTAICEDAVVIAGEGLRAQLKEQYPETYRRIKERQNKMRTVLGINLSDDVLPMNNLTGVYFPFMLDKMGVFAKTR